MEDANQTEFAAPWGTALKIVSAVATAILLGVAVLGFVLGSLDNLSRAGMIALPLTIMACCLVFIVRGYAIRGENLHIRRLFWMTVIPLAGLAWARHDPSALRRSLRLFGNGGLYSFTGIFRNKELGTYRAYVNDLQRAVVLKLRDRTVVISPDRPDEFVAAVTRHKAIIG